MLALSTVYINVTIRSHNDQQHHKSQESSYKPPGCGSSLNEGYEEEGEVESSSLVVGTSSSLLVALMMARKAQVILIGVLHAHNVFPGRN